MQKLHFSSTCSSVFTFQIQFFALNLSRSRYKETLIDFIFGEMQLCFQFQFFALNLSKRRYKETLIDILQKTFEKLNLCFFVVLGIRDILVRIRIQFSGSVPLTKGSQSGSPTLYFRTVVIIEIDEIYACRSIAAHALPLCVHRSEGLRSKQVPT